MIPNFLVFSFLHYFEKNKIKTSSGYKNRELRLTDKPEWTWNDYSWTAGSHMDPRVVDITEEMGKWMDLKCAQPNNTNIMRNPQGESWLGPTWLGVEGGWDDDDLMLQRAWDAAEAPASLQERALLMSSSLLHVPWHDSYPHPCCGPGNSGYKVWICKLDVQVADLSQ